MALKYACIVNLVVNLATNIWLSSALIMMCQQWSNIDIVLQGTSHENGVVKNESTTLVSESSCLWKIVFEYIVTRFLHWNVN